MDTAVKVGLGLVGAVGVTALIASSGRSANAAAAPGASDAGAVLLEVTPVRPVSGYTPTSSTLQARPLPDPRTLTDRQKHDVVAVAQRQFNQVGYGPLVVDGIVGDNTNRAARQFLAAERLRIDAYDHAGLTNANALLEALDDKYRENTGAPRAPDYVAAPSSGLVSRMNARMGR